MRARETKSSSSMTCSTEDGGVRQRVKKTDRARATVQGETLKTASSNRVSQDQDMYLWDQMELEEPYRPLPHHLSLSLFGSKTGWA